MSIESQDQVATSGPVDGWRAYQHAKTGGIALRIEARPLEMRVSPNTIAKRE
jgi:hypothetical protein